MKQGIVHELTKFDEDFSPKRPKMIQKSCSLWSKITNIIKNWFFGQQLSTLSKIAVLSHKGTINFVFHELTKLDEFSKKDQVKVSKSQSLTSKIKAKFVNFVNYAMRIFNSVWCMVYGVCTDEGTYSPRVLSRITPTCIGNDQVMTPRLPRLDSVSIPSRCRVLAKYVASLALFLCLGVGL